MTNFVTRFKDNTAYLEIIGDNTDQNDYFVEFIDLDSNNVEYSTTIKINYWTKLDNISDLNILIKVVSNNEIVFERSRNQKFNRVYIKFGSQSIGDNVAWIPYVEEYRKIHNVEVVLFTYHNYLFNTAYKDIIFTDVSESNFINDVDKKSSELHSKY